MRYYSATPKITQIYRQIVLADGETGIGRNSTSTLSFENNYTEGAHEKILQRLLSTNLEQLSGYGNDPYCESAKIKIREACQCPQAEISFLVGGTRTNATVIDALFKRYEGAVAAKMDHASVHEVGAIEYTGRKVLGIPQNDGKISAGTLEDYLQKFRKDENHEHVVFPGMVYISHLTEYGILYSKQEPSDTSLVCRKFEIPLYLDGARLGYGIMSETTDATLPMIAGYCDVSYIGDIKVGALCGEVVMLTRNHMPPHLMMIVKQHGALLTKGRLLGIQLDTLFTDNLYFKISRHAIEMAELLKDGFRRRNRTFAQESLISQQFIVLQNSVTQKPQEKVAFSFWKKADEEHTVVRFVASWATKEDDITKLIGVLE